MLHNHEVAVPPFSARVILPPGHTAGDAGVILAVCVGLTVTVIIFELAVDTSVPHVTLSQ